MTSVKKQPLADERILLVAEYYPIGGTRTYVKQLLDFYHRMGASVTLVTTMNEPDSEIEQLTGDLGFTLLTYSDVVDNEACSRPSVWSTRRFAREKQAFRAFAQKNGFRRVVVSAGTPGLLLGALHAKPSSLYILHTYPHGRRQKLLARPYLSHRIPRSAQIVCVSNFQQRVVERLWSTNQRGVQVVSVVNTCGSYQDARDWAPAPWQVLTVSMVEEYKQPLEWIEVARLVSRDIGRENIRFLWLGDGSLLEESQEAARQISDEANISFPGAVQGVDSFYADSHLYFQFSTIENMSLAVLDALRRGLPAVVTDVGGLPEIIQGPSDGLLVPASDVEAAAFAIKSLLKDEMLWRRISANGLTRYRCAYSPELWDEAMLGVHLSPLE